MWHQGFQYRFGWVPPIPPYLETLDTCNQTYCMTLTQRFLDYIWLKAKTGNRSPASQDVFIIISFSKIIGNLVIDQACFSLVFFWKYHMYLWMYKCIYNCKSYKSQKTSLFLSHLEVASSLLFKEKTAWETSLQNPKKSS